MRRIRRRRLSGICIRMIRPMDDDDLAVGRCEIKAVLRQKYMGFMQKCMFTLQVLGMLGPCC